jgi:hypothetical protein
MVQSVVSELGHHIITPHAQNHRSSVLSPVAQCSAVGHGEEVHPHNSITDDRVGLEVRAL